MDSTKILIGTQTQFISLAVLSRSHPNANNYWDGNWLSTDIKIAVGAFRGRVVAELRSEDFADFNDQLRALSDSLAGQAIFSTTEGWLKLEVNVDRSGHVAIAGLLRDQPGVGNELKFNLALDQTFLRGILDALASTLTAYPVIGKQ